MNETVVESIEHYRKLQKEKMQKHKDDLALRKSERLNLQMRMAQMHNRERDPMSYQAIGEVVGLSRQRVHQLLKAFAEESVTD